MGKKYRIKYLVTGTVEVEASGIISAISKLGEPGTDLFRTSAGMNIDCMSIEEIKGDK